MGNDRSDKWVPCSHRNFRGKANHHCISSARVKRGWASFRYGKRIPRIRRNCATHRSSAGPAHARARLEIRAGGLPINSSPLPLHSSPRAHFPPRALSFTSLLSLRSRAGRDSARSTCRNPSAPSRPRRSDGQPTFDGPQIHRQGQSGREEEEEGRSAYIRAMDPLYAEGL